MQGYTYFSYFYSPAIYSPCPSVVLSFRHSILPAFRFCSLSWEWLDRIEPNFAYIPTLTRPSLGLLPVIFLQNFDGVMALDLRQNFVSAQYLENGWTESGQILYVHQHWQDPAWDCCPSFFAKFWRSYGPWLTSEFCFRAISREWTDRIWPKFVRTSLLTSSSLRLLPVIFRQILPLIDIRISFPLNILRTNWQNLTKICLYININNFDWVMVLDWRQNFFSAQYLKKELTESDQILRAHQHWQALAWDCCLSHPGKMRRSGAIVKSSDSFSCSKT